MQVNKCYYFYLVLFLIIFIQNVEAEGEVILVEDVRGNIVRPCFYNNNYCDSTFQCNLTISNLNGDIILNNLKMTYNPSYYNLSLIINNSGSYNGFMVCYYDDNNGKDTFSIVVNNSGGISSIPRIYAQIFAIVVFILITTGLLLVAFKSELFTPLRYSSGIIAFLLIFVIFNLSINLLRDEIADIKIINFFDNFAIMSIYIYYFGIGLIFFVWILTIILNVGNALDNKKRNRVEGIV